MNLNIRYKTHRVYYVSYLCRVSMPEKERSYKYVLSNGRKYFINRSTKYG